MTATIDTSRDLTIEAIALLAKTAIVAAHSSDALRGVYEHPRTLYEIDESALPALVVYCRDQQDLEGVSGRAVEQLEVVFEYALPSSNLQDERPMRWPTLRAVWRTLVDVMRAGHHAALQDGADLFAAADLSMQSTTGRVRFQLMDGGRAEPTNVPRFPFLRGTMQFECYPFGSSADAAAQLHKFLSMHATYTQPSATAATPSLPGTSTGEGAVETALQGYEGGLE